MPNDKIQRIRDPIYGLIAFSPDDPVDSLCWRLVNTREFQRLRRIRQLGFSDLVYPGATHSRLAHSLGVFHNARRLLRHIKEASNHFSDRRALVTACAALLHDVGHGPFSHAFEHAVPARRKHEHWTAEIIRGDTEICNVLSAHDKELADEVADLFLRKEAKDIYDSVVSSQFDADRLDYLRRDRYMAGIGSGGFDFDWLFDALKVGKVTLGIKDDQDFSEVDGFVLGEKGLQAAESYLLARYHLYAQVYLHKTTRAAEVMLTALLTRLVSLLRDGNLKSTGLQKSDVLVRFLKSDKPRLSDYIMLDDAIVWSAIARMEAAGDGELSSLARGLRERALFKCFDVGALTDREKGDSLPRYKRLVKERFSAETGVPVLTDKAKLSAYGLYDYDERGAFQKVLIGRSNGNGHDDIADRSSIVKAMVPREVYRVYCADDTLMGSLRKLWEEVRQ
mgnify:FL=1